MKKNFLWLLLFVPAFFIAASSPIANDNYLGDTASPCAEYGGITKQYNGNNGCPYTFDFSEYLSANCGSVLVDVDLIAGGDIDHSVTEGTASYWTTGNQIIHMLPNSGYGGPGFTLSLDITAYFEDANEVITTEDVTWTCYLDHNEGPYMAGCY